MRLGACEERSGEAAAVQETSFELGSGLAGTALLAAPLLRPRRTGE
ncbi:hypothetical protein ACGFZB_06265 [Streptomyces cinerochromogenes]|uniref:Uncharacterized protein n=1 Tax=Streptomyces cinerochromogenes TaxID=66422 RepID=A0ABW7AYT6_9ACTN